MKNLSFFQMQVRMMQDVLAWVFNPINAAIIATMVPFKEAATSLKTQTETIQDLFAEYFKILKGIAEARRQSRIELAQKSYVIIQAARAYFISIGNTVAAAELKISVSTLKYMGYEKLAQKILSFQTLIEPVVPDLAAYNITPASFTEWQKQLDDYNEMESAHAGVAQRKSVGIQIATGVKSAMDFLRTQCDTTVHSIADEHFVQTYFNNRRLVREGIHHTGAHVQLQNEIGETYGPQITITVNELIKNGRTYKAVSAVTGNTGAADISAFEPGSRTITVSGNGIQSATFGPYIFQKGRILDFDFTIQPDFTNMPAHNPQPEAEKVIVR